MKGDTRSLDYSSHTVSTPQIPSLRWDYIGDYCRGYLGHERSLDYGSNALKPPKPEPWIEPSRSHMAVTCSSQLQASLHTAAPKILNPL